jgi:hypothetical protein
MKAKIIFGAALVFSLILLLPSIPAVEYDVATQAQKKCFPEEFKNIDHAELEELMLSTDIDYEELQKIFDEDGGKPTFILLPLKWLTYILLKVMMLPLELVLKILVKILVLPLKLLSIPFKLMLLPFRLLLLPLNLLFIQPIVVLIRILTTPFRLLDLFLFILFPFRHSLRD